MVSFIMEYITSATPESHSDIHFKTMNILISLSMDVRTNYLREIATNILTKLLGQDNDNEARLLREHLLGAGNTLLDMCLNLPHLSRYTKNIKLIYLKRDSASGCQLLI